MIESEVICPSCKKSSINVRYQTFWMCSECGEKYSCISGIPKLYLEDSLEKADKEVNENIYKFTSWFYNFWNPFIMLPIRPIKVSVKYWLVYFLIVFLLSFMIYNVIDLIAFRGIAQATVYDVLLVIPLVIFIWLLIKDPRYAYLLLLSIPIKIILAFRNFVPKKSHATVHAEFLKEYLASDKKVKVLDIASGTGNSLFRHGYMKLNAEYTAVDLAEGMIVQGRSLMSKQMVPTDFIITDATKLPFKSETFDITINYGAVNLFADPKNALMEMARVTKKGGKILFLDEQEYESASWLEHIYFNKCFAYNNTTVGCPVWLLPTDLEDIQVEQVYEFVYICTARKKM